MKELISKIAAKEANLTFEQIKTLLEVAKEASEIGGEILMKYYGQVTSIESKGRVGDLVTNADLESEKEIVKYLKNATPEIGIYAEEGACHGSNRSLLWSIDPLDGTTNYAHGYPFFATSIGLTFNDMPILGSVKIPFLKEKYWAAPGIGSFCNDNTNQVSTTPKLIDSLLVSGFSYDRFDNLDNNYAEFCALTHKTRGVRRGGAAAVDMAFVAAGRLDGYWERGLAKWDLAAGVPIVELAGGVVTDYKKENFDLSTGRILTCNPFLEAELKNELSKVRPLDQNFYR